MQCMAAGQVGVDGTDAANLVELAFNNVPDPARIHLDVTEEGIALDQRRKHKRVTSNHVLVRNET